MHWTTWHNGAVPEDEIWLKLGGDKGGGTFKMSFQILNVESPNAPKNTCVFSIIDATDTYTNMKICLARHIDDMMDLESHTWRCCNM